MRNGSPNTGKWLALAAAILGWMFDGVEIGLFPLVAKPALNELMGEAETKAHFVGWLAVVTAVFLLGAAFGGVLFGWLGDRIGRVKAMVYSVLTYAIFSGLCGFAQAAWQLAVLRAIASLGMGGEWALGVALVMEIWPSRARPILAGLIGAAANIGFLLIALLGLAIAKNSAALGAGFSAIGFSEATTSYLLGGDKSGWRLLMFAGALPALLTFVIRIFVPESERWQHATAAGRDKPRLAEIFSGKLLRNTLLGTLLSTVVLLGTWGSIQWIPSWVGEQLQPGDPAARAWAQIYSACGASVGSLLVAFVAVAIPRRWTYFLLSASSLIVCSFLFRGNFAYGSGFLWTVALAGLTTAGFYGWLPLYLPELFPTRIRATGQGFAYNAGRIFAAVGTLLNAQLAMSLDKDFARCGALTCLIYAVGMVVIWFCPETKGQPLPE